MDLNLGEVAAFGTDNAGQIYGALELRGVGGTCIAVFDLRKELLETDFHEGDEGGLSSALQDALPVVLAYGQQEMDMVVGEVLPSASGRYVLLNGWCDEERSVPCVAIMDLHGGRPLPADYGGRGSMLRQRECPVHYVDTDLFDSRPGLAVLQAAWHPHSEAHVLLLTSDSRLRLYNTTTDLSVPEQVFHARTATHQQGATFSLAAASSAAQLSGFAFGAPLSWGMFSVLLLAEDGGVHVLCPVAPFGMKVPASVVLDICAWHPGRAWAQQVFGAEAVDNSSSRARWAVLPHVLYQSSPALQRLVVTPAAASTADAAHAVRIEAVHAFGISQQAGPSLSEPSPVLAGSGSLQSATAVITAHMDGCVSLHALHAQMLPAWNDEVPQVAMSTEGTVSSVRYTSEPVQTSSSGSRGPAGMLLVDVIELPEVPQGYGTYGRSTGGSSEDQDNEDEEEAVAGCSGPTSLALALHAQSDYIWVAHAGGCWGISLPWLQELVSPVPGGLTHGSIADDPSPPCIQEALRVQLPVGGSNAAGAEDTKGAVLCSVSLSGPLLGTCLIAQRESGSLQVFRPLGTAAQLQQQAVQLKAPQVSSSSTGIVGAGASASGSGQLALAGSSSGSSLQRSAEAMVAERYESLLARPRTAQLPAVPSDSSAASPGGLRYLADSIAALRGGVIEFLHESYHSLSARAGEVEEEAHAHAASVPELALQLAQLLERQAVLDARLGAAKELTVNLKLRAALLASLHWSMPRPLSDAERTLQQEFTTLQDRRDALARTWRSLQERVQALITDSAAKGRAGGLPAARLAHVPEAQLAKVFDALQLQNAGLAAARDALSVLTQQMEASRGAKQTLALEQTLAAAMSQS